MKTLIAEEVLDRMWCFQVSFLSNHSPSHLCVPDGLILVPLGSCTWHSSDVSILVQIKEIVLEEHHDYLDLFGEPLVQELPPHRTFDHQI
jgi:hypothetical protein